MLELPVKCRQVIYLYYYEGYRTAEIADMLHCPESTIRNQLLRGRKLLKRNSPRGARAMTILAAVLAGSLFVTTAVYAVRFYRLRDLGVGKEMVLDLSGQEQGTGEIIWEERFLQSAHIECRNPGGMRHWTLSSIPFILKLY